MCSDLVWYTEFSKQGVLPDGTFTWDLQVDCIKKSVELTTRKKPVIYGYLYVSFNISAGYHMAKPSIS